MKTALFKDIIRQIRYTFNRFLAIFAIVALGVGFFAGIKATCPDMKETADAYFRQSHLMDYELLSTYGVTEEDVEALKAQPGVSAVMPSYSMDAVLKAESGDVVVKLHSILTDAQTGDPNFLNQPKVVEGRLPEKSGECVVDSKTFAMQQMEIGDTITLDTGTEEEILDSLRTDTYAIVGKVETPLYLSLERGSSTIGNGEIQLFLMIPQEDFNLEYYTEVYLQVQEMQQTQAYSDEYDELAEKYNETLETFTEGRAIVRLEEVKQDAQEELDQSRQEFEEERTKAQEELRKAEQKLDDADAEIQSGKQQLSAADDQLSQKEKELADAQVAYEQTYQEQSAALQEKEEELAALNAAIAAQEESIQSDQNKLEELNAEYQELIDAGKQEQADALLPDIRALEQAIQQNQYRLSMMQSGQKELEDGIQAGWQTFEQAMGAYRQEIESARALLDQSKAELAVQQTTLEQAEQALKAGRTEYESQKRSAEEELQKAQEKLDEAQREIDEIQGPTWYVLGRDMNAGLAGFGEDSLRIDNIAKVFPVFFFLVAALVCLTTMTRMVEEQRVQIGTLKALGYSKRLIAAKYLIYAASASILGSIVGLLIGFRVFPSVIVEAYGMLYSLPEVMTPFRMDYAILSTVVATLCTTLSAWFACQSELLSAPATLMRPKAPKMGKRILLERIGFFWKRLSFTKKVTARNLFRYKKRFFMTMLGIGGCTALMLAGFGLRDSIGGIIEKQFGEIYQYDATVNFNEDYDVEGEDLTAYQDVIEQSLYWQEKSMDIRAEGRSIQVSLCIPQEEEKLPELIKLQHREDKSKIDFPTDGIILTEKLSKKLGVSEGDTVFIQNGNEEVALEVAGITEHYAMDYAYVTREVYEEEFGPLECNMLLIQFKEGATEEQTNAFRESFLQKDGVQQLSFTADLRSSFDDMIQSLNYVILVLIISASLLAFVVLYNLTNINIVERTREIATIKVLGFYDREVSSYVFRENIVLTFIGIAAGMVLGIVLHRFVVQTAEVDMVMFDRVISLTSYLISAALTVVFSFAVNFVMYFKLKKVDMVESLKSIE